MNKNKKIERTINSLYKKLSLLIDNKSLLKNPNTDVLIDNVKGKIILISIDDISQHQLQIKQIEVWRDINGIECFFTPSGNKNSLIDVKCREALTSLKFKHLYNIKKEENKWIGIKRLNY